MIVSKLLLFMIHFLRKMGDLIKYRWELNHWILNITDSFTVKLDLHKRGIIYVP